MECAVLVVISSRDHFHLFFPLALLFFPPNLLLFNGFREERPCNWSLNYFDLKKRLNDNDDKKKPKKEQDNSINLKLISTVLVQDYSGISMVSRDSYVIRFRLEFLFIWIGSQRGYPRIKLKRKWWKRNNAMAIVNILLWLGKNWKTNATHFLQLLLMFYLNLFVIFIPFLHHSLYYSSYSCLHVSVRCK